MHTGTGRHLKYCLVVASPTSALLLLALVVVGGVIHILFVFFFHGIRSVAKLPVFLPLALPSLPPGRPFLRSQIFQGALPEGVVVHPVHEIQIVAPQQLGWDISRIRGLSHLFQDQEVGALLLSLPFLSVTDHVGFLRLLHVVGGILEAVLDLPTLVDEMNGLGGPLGCGHRHQLGFRSVRRRHDRGGLRHWFSRDVVALSAARVPLVIGKELGLGDVTEVPKVSIVEAGFLGGSLQQESRTAGGSPTPPASSSSSGHGACVVVCRSLWLVCGSTCIGRVTATTSCVCCVLCCVVLWFLCA
mmetsp:Transcript_28311/g.76705  ORF Transcript_28311/g.76705 Transcript_28311/m.76705 type:complete len:301 (-) Transcript_28311:7-909(-)